MTPVSLTFETTRARTRLGWQAFYLARDGFLREQVKRRGGGLAFADYVGPDGTPVETWLVPGDLHHHALVLGSTGTGKSSLLEAQARFHFQRRHGIALLDLHGDLFERTAAWAIQSAVPDLVLLDFTQPGCLPGWNPLKHMPGVDPGRQVDLLVGVLKRLYAAEDAASWAWGVKVEEIFRYTLRASIESRTVATLVDLRSFLLIPRLREKLLETASAETRAYFERRFGRREEMYVSAVLNKLEPFLGSIAVQRFLGQPESTVDLFDLVDRGGTVLVNLAKGYLGPTADVIGRLLVNVLQLAALRREGMPLSKRVPFSIVLDEAHNLAAPGSGLEDLLVAARKYRVYVTLAAQSLSLFPPSFRPHLLGNTGRQYFFRLPHSEAQSLAADLFEPLGTVRREAVRPYDSLSDPLLTPAEEIAARTKELANLPIGACYWALRGRRYKARRIQVRRPLPLPYRPGRLVERIRETMLAYKERHLASGVENQALNQLA